MDKSRQQFEKEMAETMNLDINEIIRHRDGDKYQSLTVSVAWHWWQASREILEVELPQRKGVCHNEYDSGYFDGIDKCEDILISNGVKIKNE